MNRKIAFRAWDKENKKWIGKGSLEYLCVCEDVVILVDYAPNKNGGYSPTKVYQLTNPEVDNLIIVQNTGSGDKNKKEIYEGDIIEYIDTRGGLNKKKREVVEYKIDDCLDIYNYTGYHTSWWKVSEIIGNKFENPELLEKECDWCKENEPEICPEHLAEKHNL